MPMETAILRIALVPALVVMVALGILYGRYRSWPPSQWRRRVLRHRAELRSQLRKLRADRHSADLRLRESFFRQHLRSIPLERLDEFPRIGPATITRLHEAGRQHLADMDDAPFHNITGIGPSRVKDLTAAVQKLLQEARSRFDARGCPEAQEYHRQRAARDQEIAALDETLRATEALAGQTREATFWNYLLHRGRHGLTDSVMGRPLPTLREKELAPAAAPAVAVPVAPPVAAVATVAAEPSSQPASFPPAGLAPAPAPPPAAHEAPAHPWLPKLRAYVGFAFAVAKADGRIAQAEKKVIREFLAGKFGHDTVLVRHIDPLMERIEAAVPAVDQALEDVRSVTTGAETNELYELAERIADAAGERNQRERDVLARIAAAFGRTPVISPAPPTEPERPVAAPPALPAQPAPAPRELLEIEPGVELTADLIRRRFTLLAEKLDPAKAAALGPEFAKLADDKRVRLRAAAEALISPFGVPLDPPAAPPPPDDLRHNPDLDAVFGA